MFHLKQSCHYYDDKCHIRPLCHVRNTKVSNGVIAWIPKCLNTNPQGTTSRVAKLHVLSLISWYCLHKKHVVSKQWMLKTYDMRHLNVHQV